MEIDAFKNIVKGISKLFFIHDSFSTLRIVIFSVESLDSHFSKMLFHTEVSKLIKGDFVILIFVISEYVFDHIFELIFIFFEDSYQGCCNFLLVEFFVFIEIVRNK